MILNLIKTKLLNKIKFQTTLSSRIFHNYYYDNRLKSKI